MRQLNTLVTQIPQLLGQGLLKCTQNKFKVPLHPQHIFFFIHVLVCHNMKMFVSTDMHDLLKRLVPAQKIAMKHNFGSVNFYFFSKVFIQNCKFSVFIQSINTQEQYIFQNLLHFHM